MEKIDAAQISVEDLEEFVVVGRLKNGDIVVFGSDENPDGKFMVEAASAILDSYDASKHSSIEPA